MILQIQNKQRKYSVDSFSSLVENVVKKTLENEKINGFLEKNQINPVFSIIFMSNNGIRKLNKEYRDIDRETDVLSFPLIDNNSKIITSVSKEDLFLNNRGQKEVYFGDIVISLEKAEEQANSFGQSHEREIAFLIVHSVLHLLGFDHMDTKSEKKMIKKQKEIMNMIYKIEMENI